MMAVPKTSRGMWYHVVGMAENVQGIFSPPYKVGTLGQNRLFKRRPEPQLQRTYSLLGVCYYPLKDTAPLHTPL
jgi:hypothetical protein